MEEHRLRVFGNIVLKETLGPNKDDVTGDWRIPHNEHVYNSFSSPDSSRVIKPRTVRREWNVAFV